jgi:predicted Zn-dependent protease
LGVIVPATGLALTCIYAYNSCLDYVPYTHDRKRFIATTPEWEACTGHNQYRTYLKAFGNDILPTDHRATVTVTRVGSRIASAAKDFTREHHAVNSINTSPFTFTVVRSDDANAFVLPGNHVFVMTGLFKYVHNEDELASILGHETAHNLARHAGERVSQNLIVKMLSYLALIIDPSGLLFSFFVPAEALFYSLPHSREHEVEADEIGFILSSQACYDPHSAKKVFARMKHDADGGDLKAVTPPEFVSTHPGYETRLSNFDEWMPAAMERFNRDGGQTCFAIRQEMKRARSLAAMMHDGR